MSKRFANFGARLNAAAEPNSGTEPDDELPENQPGTDPKSKKKDKDMTSEEEIAAGKAEAQAAGFKAANERMNAVFASEHYEGREATAKTLLAKDMTAEDIIDVLATTPKAIPAAAGASEEQLKAAREEGQAEGMKSALGNDKNSAVEPGQGGGNDKNSSASSAQVWDKAIARVFPGAAK